MTDDEYLAHIEKAILEIQSHTAGLTQETYEADSKTQRAVERNLQIVGEAAHKLSAALKQAHPDIPWDDVYAARNVVVHYYFGVNQKILWDILHQDLGPLLKKVQELLTPSRGPATQP
jgi:uncharacterized protein with HEPN domain